MSTKKTRGRVLSGAVAVASGMVLLAGCGGSVQEGGGASGEGETFKIGVAWPNLNDPFFAQIKGGMESQAEGSTIEIVSVDATENVTKQLDQVNQLLSQDIDVLFLAPIEAASAVSAAQAAQTAGVPVITLDRQMPEADEMGLIASHIGAPAYMGGQLQAQFICSQVPEARVLGLWGPAGSSTSNERIAGFRDTLKDDPNCAGAELLQEMNTASQEEATNVTQGWLEKYPEGEFDAIASFADPWGAGALQAVLQANRDVIITGAANFSTFAKAVCDGTPQATATIDFANAWVGEQIIVAAEAIRDGGVEALEDSYDAEEIIVTAENCADYPYVE